MCFNVTVQNSVLTSCSNGTFCKICSSDQDGYTCVRGQKIIADSGPNDGVVHNNGVLLGLLKICFVLDSETRSRVSFQSKSEDLF